MKVITLMVLLLLCGCATKPVAKVEIPASLLQYCEPLHKLEGTTGKDLLKNVTENAALYHACADSKKALIEAVKPKE